MHFCCEGAILRGAGTCLQSSHFGGAAVFETTHQTRVGNMATRITIGLITLVAIIQGLFGDQMAEGMGGVMMLLLAVLGLIYAAVAIDAEDATAFLVVALAVGAAAGADVLNHIHFVGEYLDAIVDQAVVALYAGVITILALRTYNRLKG